MPPGLPSPVFAASEGVNMGVLKALAVFLRGWFVTRTQLRDIGCACHRVTARDLSRQIFVRFQDSSGKTGATCVFYRVVGVLDFSQAWGGNPCWVQQRFLSPSKTASRSSV